MISCLVFFLKNFFIFFENIFMYKMEPVQDYISITSLSHELLCHIISFLPLQEMLSIAMLCRKLFDAVAMHLHLCKHLDFSQGVVFGYMPSSITDEHMHTLLKKCPSLEVVYGLHPLKVERRRLRKRSALTVPGIIEALCLCPRLKGIETCDLRLMEAILQHLPHLEIIGHFRNRDGTFPPQAAQRLKLQPYPRITSLHLTGVEVPELTVMPDLQHLYLQWVRFTKPHPFRVFMAPNLKTFVMRHCMGPPVALRYLSLIVALSAAPSLMRLELVRVPVLGGLIQRAVEDSWKSGGFRKLQTLVIGGCKNVLESDVGHLMIVASQHLESVCLQPSLTKDSLFVSLSFAQCDFAHLKTLHLGYVDDFPPKGEWSSDFLLTLGLADVLDVPSSLTDSGMKVISKLFPNVKHMMINNCPHLMAPDLWAPEGLQAWKNLTDLTLQRCHCLRLPSFALFLALLPSVETVILEDMFREPPKGCSHVGLSAGTGLGMSSAVVSNQEEQMAVQGHQQDIPEQPQDEQVINGENEQADRELIEIEDERQQHLIADNQEPRLLGLQQHIFEDQDDRGYNAGEQYVRNDENIDQQRQQLMNVNNIENIRNACEMDIDFERNATGHRHEIVQQPVLKQNIENKNVSENIQNTSSNADNFKDSELSEESSNLDLSKPSTSFAGQCHKQEQHNTTTSHSCNESDCQNDSFLSHVSDNSYSNNNRADSESKPQGTNKINLNCKNLPSENKSISKYYSTENDNFNQSIIYTDSNRCASKEINDTEKLNTNAKNIIETDMEQPSTSRASEELPTSAPCETILETNNRFVSHTRTCSAEKSSTSSFSYQGPLTRQRKRMLCVKSIHGTTVVNQGTQATTDDIRQSLGRQRSVNTSSPNISENSSYQVSSNVPPMPYSSRCRKERKRSKPVPKDSLTSKPDMQDKATSTSDPLLEDDAVQTFRVVSETLISLTVVSCGVSDVIIDHCHRLIHVEVQACRILKKIHLRHCPSLVRLGISQCPKLEISNLVSEVLFLPTRRGRIIFVEPCGHDYSSSDIEEAIFSNASLEHDIILLHDYSPDENDRAAYREKLLSWLRLFSRMSRSSVLMAKRKSYSEAKRCSMNIETFPWGHHLTRIFGKFPDGRYEITTNNPLLPGAWSNHNENLQNQSNCFPSPETCGYIMMSQFVSLLLFDIAEWKEIGHGIQTRHIGFYVHMTKGS